MLSKARSSEGTALCVARGLMLPKLPGNSSPSSPRLAPWGHGIGYVGGLPPRGRRAGPPWVAAASRGTYHLSATWWMSSLHMYGLWTLTLGEIDSVSLKRNDLGCINSAGLYPRQEYQALVT